MNRNPMMIIRFSMVFALLVFFHASPSNGFVSGTITDTLGRTVQGAVVTFKEEADTTLSFAGITDTAGNYRIDITTSVNVHAPKSFSLEQNYPNPFNPSTIIPFTLQSAGRVNLTIYSVLGQKVITLIDGYSPAGRHSIPWNGMDNRGGSAGSGVYFCRLVAGNRTETIKMLLLDGGLLSTAVSTQSPKTAMSGADKITTQALYRVTILGDSIVTFSERNVALAEGEVHDFKVIGKVFHPTGITLAALPGGTFQMGDETGTLNDMQPSTSYTVHTVTVSSFRMSEAEITNLQYCAYLNEAFVAGDIIAEGDTLITGFSDPFKGYDFFNLNKTEEHYYSGSRCWITFSGYTFSVVPGKENWPVVFVTWYGAKAFAYHYGWDLPREAEWEYACRGGKQYMWGTVDGTIDTTKAWYTPLEWLKSDFTWRTHPVDVKSYQPNPFGLYDMSGNAWEWVNDVFLDYPREPVTDPTGPAIGILRVSRGGGIFGREDMCRAAWRSSQQPHSFEFYLGFRVVSR
jgi:formylglycine-generating enzyme required for sulfatase activity